ncbi:uncharacterized protein Dwil_GK22955 [Drosophila willistoni]|uniref:Uncharacterized protein n=1 Tax=Drosophila willistoni TaxID=7260 RepID=B4NN50_DROWI|nr:uncharacterized protein LOC6652530 [Drosophila willistoni]EDW85789.1 uncharacterized protein Dwil_GK22955 [Drosophila willistoni]
MESVKSFFGNSNKESNLSHQQSQSGMNSGMSITNRWQRWSSHTSHTDSHGAVNSAMDNTNQFADKRKDSDNYFYIMWRA